MFVLLKILLKILFPIFVFMTSDTVNGRNPYLEKVFIIMLRCIISKWMNVVIYVYTYILVENTEKS